MTEPNAATVRWEVRLVVTDDGDSDGERTIVIVAKGEAAQILSDAYDEAVADLPEGDRDAIH